MTILSAAMKAGTKTYFLYCIIEVGIIEAFNSTSRYLDGLLTIDNPYFKGMVTQFVFSWTVVELS